MNPTIRNSQLDAFIQQKQQAYARLVAAQPQIQRRLDSFQIKSPIDARPAGVWGEVSHCSNR